MKPASKAERVNVQASAITWRWQVICPKCGFKVSGDGVRSPGQTVGQVRRVQEEHVPGVTSSCSACQWFYSGGPTRPLSARAASDVGAQVQGRDGRSRRTPNSQLLLETGGSDQQPVLPHGVTAVATAQS